MEIDDAIKCLRDSKKRGTKHIVFAFWEADMFECKDNHRWAERCDKADEDFDWSVTHGQLSDFFDQEV